MFTGIPSPELIAKIREFQLTGQIDNIATTTALGFAVGAVVMGSAGVLVAMKAGITGPTILFVALAGAGTGGVAGSIFGFSLNPNSTVDLFTETGTAILQNIPVVAFFAPDSTGRDSYLHRDVRAVFETPYVHVSSQRILDALEVMARANPDWYLSPSARDYILSRQSLRERLWPF